MITIALQINAMRSVAYACFTEPSHIKQWYFASDDWHAPEVRNDLRIGGSFLIRMEEKSGAAGFDFEGTYTELIDGERIVYKLADGRTVVTTFKSVDGGTEISQTFDVEDENSAEAQRIGWQAILNNYKRHCEQAPQ